MDFSRLSTLDRSNNVDFAKELGQNFIIYY